MQSAPLNSLILGEEPLLVRCAEDWLARGHRIVAIVSRSIPVRHWAHRNGLKVLERNEYAGVLQSGAVDVIFSITYPAIIPTQCLAAARVAAVNFHDGPLPRYAGMNGSAWALHNGETSHAIVWHHLTEGLDEGDVLERRDIELDPRETSVSLNMRNSVLALESFGALVKRIEQGDLKGTPQRTDITRTVFSRHDRPANLAVIDWSRPATDIDALVRACDFGPFNNPFAVAKIVHNGKAVVLRTAELLSADIPASATAGTVIAVEDGEWQVACGKGRLGIRSVESLTGMPMDLGEAAAYLSLKPGDVLGISDPHRIQLASVTRVLARAEAHWVQALAQRELPLLPVELLQHDGLLQESVQLPHAFLEQFQGVLQEAVSALFGFVLLSLSRQERADFAFVDVVQMQCVPSQAHHSLLMMDGVPLRLEALPDQTFGDLVRHMAAQRKQVSERAGVLLDVVGRHTVLKDAADLRQGSISPVVVVLDAESGEKPAFPPGTVLALRADPTGGVQLQTPGRCAEHALESIAKHMLVVANKVAAEPEQKLATVNLLDAAQFRQQVVEWNDTAKAFRQSLRIHDLFEEQVAQRPDAVALVFEGNCLTFSELEQQANRVANALQARGVRVGDFVAVLVERGFDLVATLIGISKAGAAYLPIDPAYPQDRAQFMLDDARCSTLVVSAEFAGRFGHAPEKLLVHGRDVLLNAPVVRPLCPASSEDICYSIYTSGSTGIPKGVVLTHKAVVNTLDWVNRTFEVGPQDRLLFVTSPSFDLSVYDLFGALGAGATVHVAPSALLQDPAELVGYLQSQGITIWDSAPPALARLASFFPDKSVGGALRLVMLSGDWIPVWLPGMLMRVFPGVKVKSLGGATEAAIWSNYFHVDGLDPAWTSIPYGFPIQNARYYILDSRMRPMPAGYQGDLYIAGECLAKEYLNRLELTAERFLPDPFHSGQRMYKTGDLARYWSNGTMEFLGRADFQVKIRGYRVEIGEVEAALRAQKGVLDAVCTTWLDGSDQKALVAYVIPKSGGVLNVGQLKESLGASLPDFMVPSYVIALDIFPLSGNGKLDRNALPSPATAEVKATYRPAESEIQQSLVDIWQDVLKRKPIGIADNFFDMGGHSLLAVGLMAQLKERLQLRVPLSRIIEHPTIEQFAASLLPVQRRQGDGDHGLVELKPGHGRRMFWVHDGDGEVLLYRNLAQKLPPAFGVLGILPRTSRGVPLVDRTVPEMAATYLERLRRFQPHGPYYLGGLCAGGVIAYEMAVQLEKAGELAELVVILDAIEPRMPARGFVASRRRWKRLQNLLSGGRGARKAGPLSTLQLVVRRLNNVVGYEWTAGWNALSVKMRLRLLDHIQANGWGWPGWIPALHVRHIYLAAKALYQPQVLQSGRVVVMRAEEGGDPDDPDMYMLKDATLGWGRVVAGKLDAMDVRGGHSTMLQEPHVEHLAKQISDLLAESSN